MQSYDIYNDIAERTSGEIYVGVVGPVRTGKSTFVSKFMQALVLPNISGKNKKQVAVDELPQSAVGKTIMTTEPKFVPAEAVAVKLGKINAKVRLIDCVGYLVEGAVGHEEGESPRLVKTPWSDENIPFEKAAEIGTQKVITEHSTIGVLITTDGSIGDIPRESFVPAEDRVVSELKQLGKPFVIVVNTVDESSKSALNLTKTLSSRHGVPAIAVNVKQMGEEHFDKIMHLIACEFPARRIDINVPEWMTALGGSDPIMQDLIQKIVEGTQNVNKLSDYVVLENLFEDSEVMLRPDEISVSSANGVISVNVRANPRLFYDVLSRECGDAVQNELELMNYVRGLKDAKVAYIKLKQALLDAQETGYGVVTPTVDEMSLDEPEVVKQGGRYGVKLKAQAPSLHIMRVDVEAEISPVVSSAQQGEELVKYLLSEFESNPGGIWDTEMFGKSLSSLVRESIVTKLEAVPEAMRGKMRKTASRVVNEGKNSMLCILI